MAVSSVKNKEALRKKLWPLLLEAAALHNVLPLTSSCNLRCLFCSHRQNPPGLKVYYFRPLSFKLLQDLISLLDGSRKIIIGESATRLCEGEPLTHPHFLAVIKELRKRFPRTPLQITTNGALLSKSILSELAALGEQQSSAATKSGRGSLMERYPAKLELVISLNSSSPARRAKIMGDSQPQQALQAVAICRKYSLPFHGSIVACPDDSDNGWEDLKRTLFFLEEMGALTTRVFLPGWTRFSAQSCSGSFFSLWRELDDFLEELKEKIGHPVLLEPPLKDDLRAVVEGVIRNSPAEQAGLKRKDVICRINGEEALTGADSFYKIQKSALPHLEVLREGKRGAVSEIQRKPLSFVLPKKKGEPSGLVFSYDLEGGTIARVAREIERKNAEEPFLFTSRAAVSFWKAAQREALLPQKLKIDVVKNAFFGGSICCAGLLTVYDFRKHLEKMTSKGQRPDLIIIPLKPFDSRGLDLRGEHYEDLQRVFPQFSFSFL